MLLVSMENLHTHAVVLFPKPIRPSCERSWVTRCLLSPATSLVLLHQCLHSTATVPTLSLGPAIPLGFSTLLKKGLAWKKGTSQAHCNTTCRCRALLWKILRQHQPAGSQRASWVTCVTVLIGQEEFSYIICPTLLSQWGELKS